MSMTADLNAMMEMRDAQVALEVARRAELGWFDVEFTMYGCVYLQDGIRYYTISENDEKIFDHLEKKLCEIVIPSEICTFSKKYPVPAGMKEHIVFDIKKELAKEMARKYPKDFLNDLNIFALKATENTAKDLLDEMQKDIEGCFNEKKISFFENLVKQFFKARTIDNVIFHQYIAWIKEERKSMEENVTSKDQYEKTFYGIAYLENETMKYYINARKSSVAWKKHELEKQHIFTSFIFSETYYYNYNVKVPELKKNFEILLKETFKKSEMEKWRNIITANGKISEDVFLQTVVETQEQYGENAKEVLYYYGIQWGII